MASAPPATIQPSQIYSTMPIPQTPSASSSRFLDISKILVGLLIALMLGAILAVLILIPRTSNGIDLRESNEKIARLQRESNENIARLQREQQRNFENERHNREDLRRGQDRLFLKQQLEEDLANARRIRFEDIQLAKEKQIHEENITEQYQLLLEQQRQEDLINAQVIRFQEIQLAKEQQMYEENITALHRLQDRIIARESREHELNITMEQLRQQRQIEEQRLEILMREDQRTEQHRREDQNRENSALLDSFIQEIMSANQPLDAARFEPKVLALIRRFDSLHNSLLIRFLYKAKLLTVGDPDSTTAAPLNLRTANLKDLDLDDMDIDSGDAGLWLNYTQLSLPITNLINASLEQIYLNKADFSQCNMVNASFRWSQAIETNFYAAKVSSTDFRDTNLTRSNFPYAMIQHSTFQNADLSQSHLSYAKIQSTDFQRINGFQANFSKSDVSYSLFQFASLYRIRMNQAKIQSANFYFVEAVQANFSHSDMSNSTFESADLRRATFRSAILFKVNFFDADVQDVDFTKANLASANITEEQLESALSITGATLPDGSKGKNQNLVRNGDAKCTQLNSAIPEWIINGSITTKENNDSNECVFEASTVNATMQQKVDIRRYRLLIANNASQVNIDMQITSTGTISSRVPPVHMIVRFIGSDGNEIGPEKSSLNSIQFLPPSRYVSTVPCPSTPVELQLTVVFAEINATVDNIYVTME